MVNGSYNNMIHSTTSHSLSGVFLPWTSEKDRHIVGGKLIDLTASGLSSCMQACLASTQPQTCKSIVMKKASGLDTCELNGLGPGDAEFTTEGSSEFQYFSVPEAYRGKCDHGDR